MINKQTTLGRVRLGLLIGGLVVAVGASGVFLGRNVLAVEPPSKQPAVVASAHVPSAAEIEARTSGLAQREEGFVAIAERLEPSVVSIRTLKTIQTRQMMPDFDDFFSPFPEGREFRRSLPFRSLPRSFNAYGAGSGVIVRSDGWILTNDHVVEGADKVTVKLHDGREMQGTVRRDYRSDLALVKIEASNLVTAEFADSDKVRVGQWAIAFGSPFALDDTMTVGVVSARMRQKTIAEGGSARFYPSLIQTDASINPGNSGGPLVDIRGRIVGINVAINSPNGGNVGIGFAIPANTAREVMEQLISRGKVTRGYLGLMPRNPNPDERQRYGVPAGGVLVEGVSDNTPASRADIQPGDVIIRFDGQPVKDEIAFREMVARTAPNRQVEIVVRRNGREQTLKATLEAAPDMQARAEERSGDEAAGGKLGIQVAPITPETARQFNLGGLKDGVVVVEVQPGSPASEAGLQPGDVILRANGRDIRSADDLTSIVKGMKRGDGVALVVQREKNRLLITVEVQ
jgi:serine protease Do